MIVIKKTKILNIPFRFAAWYFLEFKTSELQHFIFLPINNGEIRKWDKSFFGGSNWSPTHRIKIK